MTMNFDKPDDNIIKEAIEKNLEQSGKAQLAKVGATLRAQGINYGKLSIFFKRYSHIVEIDSDDSVFPPVIYAKLKGGKPLTLSPSSSVTANPTPIVGKGTTAHINTTSPKDALQNWAWLSKEDKPTEMAPADLRKWLFNEYQKTISDLKELALDERWFYQSQNKSNPYPILVNYLIYTYYRL
jgi:hypothetical protein